MTAPSAQLPVSVLGRHRLLSPTAGVHVSPLCLGAMNFGTAWEATLGVCSKETAFEILDYYYQMGGNFIDTADNYQFGQSERWLGEWMAQHPDRRDEMVIATKYTSAYKGGELHLQQSNFGSNNTKSMVLGVESSLRNLGTTYIDLLYVHYWDFTCGVEEVMQSLNHLVAQGKVLYLGVSDTPAWIVVKANSYARQHGLRPFSVYQGRWSAALRDFERDILPMCRDEGMGIAPWGTLGGGYFKPTAAASSHSGGDQGRNMATLKTGQEETVAAVLEKVANAHSPPMPITSIALTYVMHKAPYVTPIIGGRKLSHLKSNIEALAIRLSQAEIDEIEAAYPFDVGFPMNFLTQSRKAMRGPEDIVFTKRLGHMDFVADPQPILPPEGVELLSEEDKAKALGIRLGSGQ